MKPLIENPKFKFMHWKQYYKTVHIWGFFVFIFLHFYIHISFLFIFLQNELCCLFILKHETFIFFPHLAYFFVLSLKAALIWFFFLTHLPFSGRKWSETMIYLGEFFPTTKKKNFALPVVYSSYSPFAWFVTNCIHSAVELGRLAMYSVVYYNIVSNVWSFPKVAPPCYQ